MARALEIRFSSSVKGHDCIDRLYNLMHMPWQANWGDDAVTLANMHDDGEVLAIIREVEEKDRYEVKADVMSETVTCPRCGGELPCGFDDDEITCPDCGRRISGKEIADALRDAISGPTQPYSVMRPVSCPVCHEQARIMFKPDEDQRTGGAMSCLNCGTRAYGPNLAEKLIRLARTDFDSDAEVDG